MRRLKTDNRSSQKGMTLVETLVSVLIFSIVFLAALGLYQVANRAYLATDAATIQQQNARYAMDRMSETLRDAGANYNATGKTNVADEQVEGAWESALFVRADFDNQREAALETNPLIPIVTTGNDEIVGYVLRKPGANNINITIKADLVPATGRDAIKSGTTITGEAASGNIQVAATTLAGQTNPPYELTRVTFDALGDPTYQVIAENVFRLSFKHMNAAGTEVITAGTASGSADSERDERASIRKIGVSLITMADRPDLGFTDQNSYTTDAFGHTAPAEGTSTKNRRKFTLSEEILGVSLGRKGARHNAVPAVVIDPPPSLKVCTGHHLSYFISWAASPTAGVATYQVSISHGSPAVTFTVLVPTTEYRYTQSDSTVEAYTFKVAGAAGSSVGTFSQVATKTATHDTTNSIPSVPVNVAATQSTTGNGLKVTWDPVTTNTGTVTSSTCTTVGSGAGTSAPPAPWNNEAVDLKTHQIYRGLSPALVVNGSFATPPGVRVDGTTYGDIVNAVPTAINSFTDNAAAPCGKYFYRVKALDSAGLVDPGAGSAAMTAAASYIPAAGVTPKKPLKPAPAANVAMTGGNYVFRLTWGEVYRDSAGAPATTAHYQLVGQQSLNGGATYSPYSSDPYYEQNTTSSTITVPLTVGTQSASYQYAVKAVYDCTALGDTDRENQSDWYSLACSPPAGNSIGITMPANGASVSRPYENAFTPALAPVGSVWTGAEIQITNTIGDVLWTETKTTAPPWTFSSWDSSSYPDGTYKLTAVGFANSCRSTPVVSTFTLETGTCGLSLVSPAWTGNGNSAYTGLTFRIQNNCDITSMTLNGLQFNWSGDVSTPNPNVTSITYNSTSYNSGLNATTGARGTTITFAGSRTAVIAANTTSSLFAIGFSDNMTDDLTKDGLPFEFTSITGSVTSPTTSTEELVDSPPLVP
jgi:prepilin-type N-terminal cleavage/methylation domain-containing protein